MKVPVIGTIDERFLRHRLRSTSNGGIAGTLVAAGFFFYNLSHNVIRWDLFAVVATAALVKIGFMIYYRLTD
jgi:hypothetical protein